MEKYYVYQHKFINGTIYIGKGKGKRFIENTSRNPHWKALTAKYGEPIKGIMYCNLTESEAFQKEKVVIRYYKLKKVLLCNLTNGGEGASGYKHTSEHKKYISLAIKEYLKDKREILSKRVAGENNPMYGKPSWIKGLTKETSLSVQAISKALTGKVRTEEHKQHLRESKLGRKLGPLNQTIYQFVNIHTDEIVNATVYTMKEEYGCTNHISSVITGNRKVNKGWRLTTNAELDGDS